jgi:predicted enzyme related to lactoylglutathione lyase
MPQEVHFDIPINESDRAERFYGGLFGWSFKKVPAPNMEYWVIRAAEGDALGGLIQRTGPDQTNVNYYTVDSIDEALARVGELGGRVVVGKTAIPYVGYNAQCVDSEGNPLGLWQNDKDAR